MSGDGRVWNVWSYPDEQLLHTADTYEAANDWRLGNRRASYICPSWPELYCTECRMPSEICSVGLCPARFTKPLPLNELQATVQQRRTTPSAEELP